MKKQKPAFYKFDYFEKVFLIDIVLCVGDMDQYFKYVGKNFNVTNGSSMSSLEGCSRRFTKKDDTNIVSTFYVIYLRNLNNFYTLSHELIHLCRTAFIDRGVPVDLEGDDETFAYLHTHLLKELWRKMGKKTNSLSKKKKTVKIIKDEN